MENTRTKLSATLEQALAMADERLAKAPNHSMLNGIKNQLQAMKGEVREGNIPTQAEKESMSLGVLALREIKDMDPEFADVLMKVDYQYTEL